MTILRRRAGTQLGSIAGTNRANSGHFPARAPTVTSMTGPDDAAPRWSERPAEQPEDEQAGVRPSFEAVRADLATVRTVGAARLRGQDLPALRQAALLLDLCDTADHEPAPLLALLREALDSLGGGVDQDAAEYLLGLTPGAGRWSLTRRRAEAARLLELQPDTFRKKPEQLLLDDIAEHVLELLHDAGMRHARTQMEARRHPSDSRLAVQWVERFEAYYRIWTPAYALAADLEAALVTYTQPFLPHMPWDENDRRIYDPLFEGDVYALQALYHYTAFKLEVKRFMSRHGGMWLASDADVELAISDAVYRIGWHNSFTEEDDAWLRRHLADARREETDHFLDIVMRLKRGEGLAQEWVDQVRAGVTWTIPQQTLPSAGSFLPSELQVPGQAVATTKLDEQLDGLPVGQTIRAAQDYTRLIDEDWLRIADWYRPGSRPQRGVSPKELWEERVGQTASGLHLYPPQS